MVVKRLTAVIDNYDQPMYLNEKEYEHKPSGVYSLEEDDEKKRSSHGLEYIEEGFIQGKKCVECKSSIAEHEGCFACPGCPYTAHKACAELPQTISGHPIVDVRLVLGHTEGDVQFMQCHYCREPVRLQSRGRFYGAIDYGYGTGFAMHATCALIPLPAMITSCGRGGKYVCHRRQMSLVEEEGITAGECFSCGSRRLGGPVYRCTGASHCKIFFHKSCAELPWTVGHPNHFDGEHKLGLKVDRPQTCIKCYRTGCRHVYHCGNWRCKEFVLGAECMFQSTSLRRGHLMTSHEHELFLVEDRPTTFRCHGCWKFHGISGVEVQLTRNVAFRCRECVTNYHFLCGPLPSAVKYEFHIHPLRLIDKHIEDDSGEYCCDVCEEDRDPQFRVYHCADCKFVAHIHCLFGEVMKLLKEDNSTNVEFKILGESSPNGSTELKSLTVRPALTISDLTHRNELLFHESNSSTEKKVFDDQCLRLMASLNINIREREIVDVDIVEELFHLNSTKFSNLCSCISINTTQVFDLFGKYWKMKVVDVRGYMVPLAFASELTMLLQKYGDLGEDSTLDPRLKSTAASLLCATVNKMQYTMAEDMSIEDVKVWLCTLRRAKQMAGLKVRECDCFEEAVMTTFLGFEAIWFEKETKKRVDLKISELEIELEKWKGKRKKLEEIVSTKSDFMTECLHRASKSKWKTAYKLF